MTYIQPRPGAPYNLDSSNRRITIPPLRLDGTPRLKQLPLDMREDALHFKRSYIRLGRILTRTPSKLVGKQLLRYHPIYIYIGQIRSYIYRAGSSW